MRFESGITRVDTSSDSGIEKKTSTDFDPDKRIERLPRPERPEPPVWKGDVFDPDKRIERLPRPEGPEPPVRKGDVFDPDKRIERLPRPEGPELPVWKGDVFDPDKRIERLPRPERPEPPVRKGDVFDPDKRIERLPRPEGPELPVWKGDVFDPDKRIERLPRPEGPELPVWKGDVFDPDKRIEPVPCAGDKESTETEKSSRGGRYQDLKDSGHGESTGEEVHHMPADVATDLPRADGPAIVMDKSDHRQTASCGNSKEAQEYRKKQQELIQQGKFREALQMDIDDIREKFGDKYDDAIAEMEAYVDRLEQEGKI